MKQNLTEIVFILDRSGSMAGLEEDTIGGFNAMLRRQKQEEGEVLVSTILFDHVSRVLHDRLPLREVPPMTGRDYYVGGCTALLDAVGQAVRHIRNVHKYAREEDRPEKTLFVITTDGLENASRQFTYPQVRQMIETQKQAHGWEFIFLGANIDAAKEAARFGIGADFAADYHADRSGTAVVYVSVSEAVHRIRTRRPMTPDWKGQVDADFKKRKK